MATKTITLTGAEVAVTGLDGANAHIRNDSAAAIYAAKSAGISAGADGVLSIPAGQSARLDSISGTVYLLGTGSVQLVSNDYTESPFKAVSTSGGADVIPNAAEVVTLDGLQGGVPFSDITLSGDIVGPGVVLNVTSENMVKMPYYDGNNTELNGVTFTVNNDGSITANGTPSASSSVYTVHYRTKETYLKLDPQKTYTLLGCPKGGASGTYVLSARLYASESEITGSGMAGTLCRDTGNGYTFSGYVGMWLYIAIWAGTTAENLTFRPMVVEHSSEYSITPDSNPYTVPNDIRQQDGINNVSVSAGEVSVTGVKRNAAVKRIWDKLDELTTAIIVSNGEIAE